MVHKFSKLTRLAHLKWMTEITILMRFFEVLDHQRDTTFLAKCKISCGP